MARKQRNIQQWATIIEQWKQSGLGIREFCLREGCSEGRFHEVRKQLETGISRHTKKTKKKSASMPAPIFLPVQVQGQRPDTGKDKLDSIWLELTLNNGHRLRFPSSINSTLLTSIINAVIA